MAKNEVGVRGQRPGKSKQCRSVKRNTKHVHKRQSLCRARARQNAMASAAWRGGFVLSRSFLLRSLQQWQRMKWGSGQRPGKSKQCRSVKRNTKHVHKRQSLCRAQARQNAMAGAAWRGGFVLSRSFLLRSLQQWQRMK